MLNIAGVNSYLSAVEKLYLDRFNGMTMEEVKPIAHEVSRRFVKLGAREQSLVRKLVDDYEVAAMKASLRFNGNHIFPGDVPAYLNLLRYAEEARKSKDFGHLESYFYSLMDVIWNNCTPTERSEIAFSLERDLPDKLRKELTIRWWLQSDN